MRESDFDNDINSIGEYQFEGVAKNLQIRLSFFLLLLIKFDFFIE